MKAPIPENRTKRIHAALIAAAALVAVVGVAAAVWAATRPNTPPSVRPSTFTPAEETTGSALTETSSAGVVETLSPGATIQTRTADSPSVSPALATGARFAFHLGRTLYVTSEDASRIVPVKVPEEVYALSPDGSAVAAVRAGRVITVEVVTGLIRDGGPAIPVAPVWAPDSRSLLFVRAMSGGDRQVWRVARDGSSATFIGAGEGMAISPDGHTVALVPERDAPGPAAVGISREGDAARPLPVGEGSPIAVALSNDRLFVSTLTRSGETMFLAMKLDGSDSRRLVGPPSAADKGATFGSLLLSPDGSRLAYTADGDDGYSRLWVVPVGGGSPVQVTSRRDGYPVSWTADGLAILFIEGNSYQGEQTALWRANLNGAGRKMLVSGARI